MFDVIALDADDTLWHNETLFSITQEKFRNLLSPYHEADWINHKLYETEKANLDFFGYGIKGFTLSMIETAIELTEGRISGAEIQSLIAAAKEMLEAPVVPLPGVEETLADLSARWPLMLITKGDLFDQESKLARSGLETYFTKIEIVSEKNSAVYRGLLERNRIRADRFLMVGNSLKSDILPVVEIGGHAVHIPYHTTWIMERIEPPSQALQTWGTIDHIGLLEDYLARLLQATAGGVDKSGD